MKTRNQTIQETLEFYRENGKPVHITLQSGRWLNGIIIKTLADRLLIKEEANGEMLVFYERIKDDGIEPRGNKK